MAHDDANHKQPLMSGTEEDPCAPFLEKNALKRRKQRHTNTNNASPSFAEKIMRPVEQNDNNVSISATKEPSFKHVAVCLAAYLGTGALSFFLIRDQIKGKKTNGVVDALYLCVVTMTTVGYGDLVPNSAAAKLLSCVFVFTGMALVGLILSKAADHIMEKQEILLVKAMHMSEEVGPSEMLQDIETNKAKYKLCAALAQLLVLIIIGIIFLSQVEEMKFIDALYCVCSTITTLGYGDESFSTTLGRTFAVFWIVSSTICLAQLFLYLAELYSESRQRSLVRWVLTRKLTVSDLEAADLDDDQSVTAAEFAIYKLKEMRKISQEDVALVMEKFRNLDVDQSGALTAADLALPQTSKPHT